MLKKVTVTLLYLVAVLAMCAGVVLAIHWLGASDVASFAGVMSFVAVAGAAVATIIYVKQTSEIAQAARESAKEQSRVAALMESDLRVRIAPLLRYEPLPCVMTRPEANIRNGGSGAAFDVKGVALYSDRRVSLNGVPPVLEARYDHTVRVWYVNEPQAPHTVLLTCTDSLGLNEYSFEWTSGGQMVRSDSQSRRKR